MARVAVIVVNWNRRQLLEGCVASLSAQRYRDFELVIVDNASTDDSASYFRGANQTVRIIQNATNLGFARAANQGIAATDGELIALVNNDVETHPEWLGSLVEALDNDPIVAGACGCVYSLAERRRLLFTLPKLDPFSARAIWVCQLADRTFVDYLSGNNMLLRREAWDRLGPLDEAYLAYYEETDWCARALRAGYRLLYVPEAVVWHAESASAPPGFRDRQMARNRVRFAIKNFDTLALPAFAVTYPVDVFLECIRRRAQGDRGYPGLVREAIWWNLVRLRETLKARRRDLGRIRHPRSYNRSLPLRRRRSDGRGGLIFPRGVSR